MVFRVVILYIQSDYKLNGFSRRKGGTNHHHAHYVLDCIVFGHIHITYQPISSTPQEYLVDNFITINLVRNYIDLKGIQNVLNNIIIYFRRKKILLFRCNYMAFRKNILNEDI